MPKKPDRRKQRTEHMLRDAFIDLILQKGYDAVTVQDITDQANLGRATFYLHYPDGKEELFMNILREIFDDLKARTNPVSSEQLQSGQVPSFSVPFQHVLEYQDLYRATLLSEAGTAAIVNGIREYLARALEERIKPFVAKESSPYPLEAITSYLAGGMISLISWWLRQNQPYTAEQMSDMFYHLAMPTIASIAQPGTKPE